MKTKRTTITKGIKPLKPTTTPKLADLLSEESKRLEVVRRLNETPKQLAEIFEVSCAKPNADVLTNLRNFAERLNHLAAELEPILS